MKLILSILFLLLSTSAVGKLDMNPKSIFLTSTVIKFIGEEGDVFGTYPTNGHAISNGNKESGVSKETGVTISSQ